MPKSILSQGLSDTIRQNTTVLLENTCRTSYLFTIFFLLSGIICIAQPTIQSFSPASASPGTQVTIQGVQFSTIITSNIIYFGAARANVVSASASSLIVTVPNGATYSPIAVTVNGFTAYSSMPFLPTFNGGGQAIDYPTFNFPTWINTSYYPRHALFADFDLDGKTDMIGLRYSPNNTNTSHLLPYLNTGTNGNIGFTAQGSYPCGIFATDMAVADFDGDGKTDVATSNIIGNELSVFLNTSVVGQINFNPRTVLSTVDAVSYIATGDIDGDGKTDIVGTSYLGGTYVIFLNQSTPGTISFNRQPTIAAGPTPNMVVLTDLNGDGKPDMLIANEQANIFALFRNASTAGSVSFAAPVSMPTPDNLQVGNIAAGDLDNDGKNDLVLTTSNNQGSIGNAWIYKNVGSGGNITFSNQGKLPTGTRTNSFYVPGIADINGDGKADIMCGWVGTYSVGVFENQSAGGTISFLLKMEAGVLSGNRISAADVTGDGKPDMLCSNISDTKITLFRNRTGYPTITTFTPATGGESAVVTINGKTFTGVTAVQFGGVAAASFTVVSDTKITATVATGATGAVKIVGPAGTDTSFSVFTYDNIPMVDSISPNMAFAGDTIMIKGKNFLRATAVQIGVVAAPWFQVVNSGTIRAKLATNSQSGGASITNPSGTGSGGSFILLKKPVITSFSPTSVASNQHMAIYGQDLVTPGYTPQVTLGGVPAVPYSITATVINLVVGNAASGYVKVSHQGGADSMAGFIYIPPPVITFFTPAVAYPADTVRISGSFFSNTTSVYFGDSLAASFTISGDTLIKAVVAHGKTGAIRVVRASGTGTRSGFTFLPLPAPVLQAFLPQRALSGTEITLTGQYLWGIREIKVGNTPVKYFTPISFTSLKIIAPVGGGGPITVTTHYGTSTLSQPVFNRVLPPVVISLSPKSAVPGQPLTISGQGFGIDMQKVVVYFGPVKAQVVSLQNTTMVVTVPVSAIYSPVTVCVENLSTNSVEWFTPVNPATAYLDIKAGSFENITEIGSSGPQNYRQTVSLDFNGDGKPDYASVATTDSRIEFFTNLSTPGKVAWKQTPTANMPTGNGLDAADFDGDGKTDLMLRGSHFPARSLGRNVSTGDSAKFEFQSVTSSLYTYAQIADMNSDGKPDIVTQPASNRLRLLMNNSLPGTISFLDTIDVVNSQYTSEWILTNVADLDKDSLPDLTGLEMYTNKMLLFRNTGTRNTPIFNTAPIAIPLGFTGSPQYVKANDLNADGLPDLVGSKYGSSAGSLFICKNNSTPGNIVFSTPQAFPSGDLGYDYSFADLNGDNKPDIVGAGYPFTCLLQNKSTPDSILFGAFVSRLGGSSAMCTGDMDGDGKPDIISNLYGKLFVMRNRLNEPQNTKLCPGGSSVLQAGMAGSSFQWQMDMGSGYTNLADNTNFTGTTTASLTISNVPSSWLKHQFRCLVSNTNYAEPYVLSFLNNWISNSMPNARWNVASNWSCGIVPDGNTDVVIPGGMSIIMDADGTCRSIKVGTYTTFTVKGPYRLTVTNR